MMRRFLLALLLLGPTSSASAAWYPRLEKTESCSRSGRARRFWLVPWTPWYFQSTNPRVARVTGEMLDSRAGLMVITAREPGRANAVISGWSDYYRVEVTVVCGNEENVAAASPSLTATTGVPITLRAFTPHSNRTTFTWYHGRTGDMSYPIGQSGPEIVYVTDDAGLHYVWVLATTSCSSSTAEFLIEARSPRRRPSRP